MAVTAGGVERLLGRHDAARRRLERALEATAPDSRERARVLADLAGGRLPARRVRRDARWARQIERSDSVDGVVRAAYATLLAVGEAFAGDVEAAERGVAAALAAVDGRRRRGARRRGRARDGDLLGPAGARAPSRRRSRSPGGSRAAARRAGNGLACDPARPRGGPRARPARANHRGRADRRRGRAGGARQRQPAARAVGAVDERVGADGARAARRGARGRDRERRAGRRSSTTRPRATSPARCSAPSSARAASTTRGRELLAAYDIDRGWICRWSPRARRERHRARRPRRRRASTPSARRRSRRGPGWPARGPRPAARRRSWRSREGDAARAAALALRGGRGGGRGRRCTRGGARPARRRPGAAGRPIATPRIARADRGARAGRRAAAPRASRTRHARRCAAPACASAAAAPARRGTEGVGSLSPREREIAEPRRRRADQPRDRGAAVSSARRPSRRT